MHGNYFYLLWTKNHNLRRSVNSAAEYEEEKTCKQLVDEINDNKFRRNSRCAHMWLIFKNHMTLCVINEGNPQWRILIDVKAKRKRKAEWFKGSLLPILWVRRILSGIIMISFIDRSIPGNYDDCKVIEPFKLKLKNFKKKSEKWVKMI